MPTYTKLDSGNWRVVRVRRKRQYVANPFIRRRDGRRVKGVTEFYLIMPTSGRDVGSQDLRENLCARG